MESAEDAAEPGVPHRAPPSQPVLDEVKMSHVQLIGKVDARLEFTMANNNNFDSSYRKFILKIKDTNCIFSEVKHSRIASDMRSDITFSILFSSSGGDGSFPPISCFLLSFVASP